MRGSFLSGWLTRPGRASTNPVLRTSPHVLLTRGEGRTVLLDMRGSRYWVLDQVADVIWSSLEAGQTLEHAVDALEARFEAPRDRLEQDAADFVQRLLKARLVEAA